MTAADIPSHRRRRAPGPTWMLPDVALTAFLLAAAAERADHPAVVDAATGRSLTYGELAHQVERAAAGFAANGLRKGDVVAILAPNSPEWLVACHGAIAAGGVVSGLNLLWSADEIATQIHDSRARFLVTVGPLAATARPRSTEAGVGTRLVLLDARARTRSRWPISSRAPTPPRTSPSTRRPTSRCCPTPAAPPAWPKA